MPKSEHGASNLDFVAGVWAADSYKKIIFAAEVGGNLPFSLASVLPANKDVH